MTAILTARARGVPKKLQVEISFLEPPSFLLAHFPGVETPGYSLLNPEGPIRGLLVS